MAIENVMMMNVVGKINYVDRFAKDIFLFNDIQIVDAMNEIDTGRFTLPVCEENIGELLGFAQLVPGENMVDEKIFVQKVQKLNELYDNKLTLDTKALSKKEYDLGEILEKADRFQNYLDTEFENLGKAREELKKVNTSIEAYEYIKNIDVKMEDLNNMEYFTYTIGSVSKDNAARLKSIYNTVTSIVFHVGDTSQNEEVFLIISPKDFEVETNRILKALNFKLVEGYDDAYVKVPGDILTDLGLEKVKLEKTIFENETLLRKHRDENRVEAEEVFNVLTLYANLNIIKKYMAFSDENFYFSGWVSKKDRAALEKIAAQYDNMIVMFTDPDAANKPPTKMKNNWVFRPFETLVKMYGVPAYNELDPTPFLSITYLFCFGSVSYTHLEAVGLILCHDMTQIIKDEFKGPRFRKGHVIQEKDIPVLLSMGKEHVYIWKNDPGMVHENAGAEVLYRLCAGEHMSPSEVKEGKIEVIAEIDGLLRCV